MTTEPVRSINTNRNTFIGLCIALFVVAFVLGSIPPMMPAIVLEFESSIGYIQSILVLSSLVTASFTPTTQNLSDVFGRKKVLTAGLGLYAIGLLVNVFSPTVTWLAVGYGVLLGIAASPLINSSWALMDYLYDDEVERQAGALMALCSIAGGITGGLSAGLIASEISWRVVFLVPLGFLPVIYWLTRSLTYQQATIVVPVDWIGGVISLMGLGLTLLGVSLAGEYGWWEPKERFTLAGVVLPPFSLSIVPVMIATGMIFLGLFYFWQRRAARLGLPSLLRAGVLRRRVFVLGVLTAMLHSMIAAGVQFNLYQFIPPILKLNAFQTALSVFPYTLATLVGFFTTTYNRTIQAIAAKRLIQTGLGLVCMGVFILWQVISPTMTALSFIPALTMMGLGSGMFLACIAGVAFSAAKPEEKAEASGVYNPLQNVGNSLGRGVFGTLLVTVISSQIVDRTSEGIGKTLSPDTRQLAINQLLRVIQTLNAEQRKELFQPLPPHVLTQLNAIVPDAASQGMRVSMLVLLGVGLLSLLLSFTLPRKSKN